MDHRTQAAHHARGPVVALGGAFMTSEEMAAEEAELGLPAHSLYFRGRSAVLGDPPAHVVTTLFGIFPDWLVELVIGKATPAVPATLAIETYARACANWGRRAFADITSAAHIATLLCRVVDAADLSALPLVAGWRTQARPADPPALLAHALMLVRELRGGLHFAALRACGLSVPEAAVVDPNGGRARLLRTGWRADDADALISHAHARGDLVERWQRAERLTDESYGLALGVLTDTDMRELTELVTALPGAST